MNKDAKIYIAGHEGLLGSALSAKLQSDGFDNLTCRGFVDLDLRRQNDVEAFFKAERPDYVFLLAAKVGGIAANISNPAIFIYDNLCIQNNVVESARNWGVKKLLFVSSSCSYPRACPQPMKEEFILSGKLEPTNEYYAIAKIAGMKLIEAYSKQYQSAFFSLIFPNLYGPKDNFDLQSSHVIPALIRKIYAAKIANIHEVETWGTGEARREFLYVEDAADACLFFMQQLSGGESLNVGTGMDISIRELAYLIKEIILFDGKLSFNKNKPDGMPKKLLDNSNMQKCLWQPKIPLLQGLERTIKWFIKDSGGMKRFARN